MKRLDRYSWGPLKMSPAKSEQGAMTFCRSIEVDQLEDRIEKLEEVLGQAEHWLSQVDRSIEPTHMLRTIRELEIGELHP